MQNNNPRVMRFALDISADAYQSYYQGAARAVVVRAFDGRNVQFPASVLQQFVTHNGVQGVFEITFDDNNKFVSIRRVDG